MLKQWGVKAFMASLFWILTKEEKTFAGTAPARIIPFQTNRIQDSIEDNLAAWNLLLKPRQTGGTTYFLLRRLFLPAIVEGGIGSLLISQSREYASKHFDIVRRAYGLIGAANPSGSPEENAFCLSLKQNLLHTVYSNRREVVFDILDSRIMVATAEVEESGQGVTLHHIVASEYSRWPGKPEDTLSNVLGALVPEGTCDKECTANGAAGPFYEDCLRAMHNVKESSAKLHYYSWWWSDDYESKVFTKLDGTQIKLALDTPEHIIDECLKDLASDEAAILSIIRSETKELAWL